MLPRQPILFRVVHCTNNKYFNKYDWKLIYFLKWETDFVKLTSFNVKFVEKFAGPFIQLL